MNTLLATPTKPTVVINFAKVKPLFEPVGQISLVSNAARSADVRLAHRSVSPTAVLVPAARRPKRAKIAEMPLETMTIPKAHGTVSRALGIVDIQTEGSAELRTPFGMPRFVNAATLKRMLKAKRGEILLKRSGSSWEICGDSLKIDLADDTVEFRLGAVQIFS